MLYIQGRSASGDVKFYDKAGIGREERLEELKAECLSPVKFMTVIRVGVRHVPEGECLRAAQ